MYPKRIPTETVVVQLNIPAAMQISHLKKLCSLFGKVNDIECSTSAAATKKSFAIIEFENTWWATFRRFRYKDYALLICSMDFYFVFDYSFLDHDFYDFGHDTTFTAVNKFNECYQNGRFLSDLLNILVGAWNESQWVKDEFISFSFWSNEDDLVSQGHIEISTRFKKKQWNNQQSILWESYARVSDLHILLCLCRFSMWTMPITVLFDQMSALRLAYTQEDLYTQVVCVFSLKIFELFWKISFIHQGNGRQKISDGNKPAKYWSIGFESTHEENISSFSRLNVTQFQNGWLKHIPLNFYSRKL